MIQGTLCSSSRGCVLKQGGQEHRLHESGGGGTVSHFWKIGLEESIRLSVRARVCVCRWLCVALMGCCVQLKKKMQRSAMKTTTMLFCKKKKTILKTFVFSGNFGGSLGNATNARQADRTSGRVMEERPSTCGARKRLSRL